MKNSQFIDLYLILNQRQRKDFRNYLASPLFNTNSKLVIYQEKIDQFLDLGVDQLKSRLFKYLYPNETYKDVKLRLLFSELLKHLKNYIYIEEKQNEDQDRELSFIRFLRKGQKINLFEKQANAFRKEILSKKNNWNPDHFELRYQVDLELLSYESTKNRFSYYDFAESSETIEVSSMLKRLRIYLEQLSHESIGATSMEYPFIQPWVDYAESKNWSKYPEVHIYLLALKMYREPDEESHFNEYLLLIRKYENDFDFERGREIFLTALNYCIRKINKNNTQFFKQTMDLFQHCVRTGWLLDYGVMSSLTYKNIIALCIRMKDLELAIKLLNEYKNLVNPIGRTTIYNFNLAKIYKEQGNFNQALYLLNTSVFKDPLIELNARVEMIKIYFEIKEERLMHNQIIATQNLIKRSKKLGYHKEYYNNFLNAAHRLYLTKKLTSLDKEAWLQSIKGNNHLIEKGWLYSMVDKIKSSKE